jgi:Peptidase S24-like
MQTEDTTMSAAPPLGWAAVQGPSMVPTLRDGDRLLVRYGVEVRPGDVVVARHPFQQDLLVVKRAVEWRSRAAAAVGGRGDGDAGYPDAEYPGAGDERRGAARRRRGRSAAGRGAPGSGGRREGGRRESGRRDGGWWLLGDNPYVPNDSREFGTVPDELVLGRVVARYRPRRAYSSTVAWLFGSVRPLTSVLPLTVDRSFSRRLRAR